jgi:hypothetical protein
MRLTVTNSKAGVNTANTIMWQIRNPASSDPIKVIELGLSVKVATTTGPSWRLNRVTALGTSSATVTPLVEDSTLVYAPACRIDTAWSANPTLASTDYREYATPNTIGSGIVWTWDRLAPLLIAAGSGIAIVNGNATGTTLGTLLMYAIIDV